jgi:nucleoside-diphosphate-sugar epimerase
MVFEMLVASRDAGVLRFVYAASSSTYNDHSDLPKVGRQDRQAAVALSSHQSIE